jgi:hypothetical protein
MRMKNAESQRQSLEGINAGSGGALECLCR